MSLLIKGITRISELDIDADKDMTLHGLFNLKEVVALMLRGDIAVKDTSQLVVVPAGAADYVLTSTGQGKIPVWAPAGGGLKYYFPAIIGLTDAEAVIPVNQHYDRNAPLTSPYVAGYIARGTADANHATILTDVSAAFVVDALIGRTIYNKTDGSHGVITDNDATTITCAGGLVGGFDNTWQIGDAYGDGINLERFDPTIASVDAELVIPFDQQYNKNAPVTRQIGLQMLVDGAIKEDPPATLVDDTANARSVGANDMMLLPAPAAPPQVNDAYYIGFKYPFDRVWLNIGTAGVGNWALTEEYWNGAWTALAGVVDLTNQFMAAAGLHSTTFTRPVDWIVTNLLVLGNMYWMRYRLSNFVNMGTQPKGTQAWCEILI